MSQVLPKCNTGVRRHISVGSRTYVWPGVQDLALSCKYFTRKAGKPSSGTTR